MNTRRLRVAGGIAVLAALALFGVWMLPPYFRNLEFQRFLEQAANPAEGTARPAELVRIAVVNKAGELGLPVRSDQVRISPSGGGYRIEVRYIVRVDMPLYTVDLHFRPSAGN